MDRIGGSTRSSQNGVDMSTSAIINVGDQDEMKIAGFRNSRCRLVITTVCSVLSVGLLQLVFYWRRDWKLKCNCVVCPLDRAEFVLLEDQYGQKFVEKVRLESADDGSVPGKPSSQCEVLLSVRSCEQFADSGVIDDTTTPLISVGKTHRYFMNKKLKFIWNSRLHRFERLCGLDEGLSCAQFHEAKGLTEPQRSERRRFYGINSIIIHVTPVVKLLFTQGLNPFYIFQLFSCALWISDEYVYYASCILIISVVSLAAQIYEIRSMQRALKTTITPVECVTVCRAETGEFDTVCADTLVPGDVIEVPRHGCIMQCDAVLVTGNCIVNESMLTGESVPITKTPIAGHHYDTQITDSKAADMFSMKEHSRHVLFCGTHVIQTRYYDNQPVKAVVIRTGFSTAKGELVRSILFPKPVDFKFSQDGVKFVCCLAFVAVIGMVYTLILMVSRGDDVWLIVRRTLDLVTIVVPPALPAAMTIGIVFAQKRLKRRNIFCISPRSVNLCGAVNVFCFDKTGTLTEDGLDLWGVVPAEAASFQKEVKVATELDCHSPLLVAMATCHSLTIIDGEIVGDPLDLKMFDASEWVLDEPGEDASKYDVIAPTVVRPKGEQADTVPAEPTVPTELDSSGMLPYEVGILRQFTFSSKLQRMSVIARELSGDHFHLYTKGSPEMIASLCDPQTVPDNFHNVLMRYTQQGYRVIGVAHRRLQNLSYVKVQRVQREQVERELSFLGLLVFENRLKPETSPVILTLKEARIRTIMVTGDNMLTALSVARDCEMVGENDTIIHVTVIPPIGTSAPHVQYTPSGESNRDQGLSVVNVDLWDSVHFSITGKSWALLRKFFPEIIPKLVVHGTIFARFSPDQKQQLVEQLQEVGYYVGMCGDGANDCGALKTAHAGISLSEAEASVASPFTSKQPNIECVPKLIMEGRAALVTSYGIFKYMAGYSMTQFLSVCLVYWIGANLQDWGFLYIDLPLLTTLGITFCYTEAHPVIDRRPPKISLLALTPILSILSALGVNLIAQVWIFIWVSRQPWFEPFDPENNIHNHCNCYEVTAVFCVSAFQYIIMAVIFAKGAPYRKSILTNRLFMLNIFLCTVATAYITVYPADFIMWLMELRLAPSIPFRVITLGIATINFFVSFIVETFVIDELIEGRLMHSWRQKITDTKLPYVRIEHELRQDASWPPTSQLGGSLVEMMRLENICFQVESEGESTVSDGPTGLTTSKQCNGITQLSPGSEELGLISVSQIQSALQSPDSTCTANTCLELDDQVANEKKLLNGTVL